MHYNLPALFYPCEHYSTSFLLALFINANTIQPPLTLFLNFLPPGSKSFGLLGIKSVAIKFQKVLLYLFYSPQMGINVGYTASRSCAFTLLISLSFLSSKSPTLISRELNNIILMNRNRKIGRTHGWIHSKHQSFPVGP